MKQTIKRLIKSSMTLYSPARKIQRIISKMKRPIIGNNNKLIKEGVLLNVKFDIIGDNNTVEIKLRSVLSDMMIFIRGNNHHLEIGENCRYRGGSVWFEDEYCEIRIGKNTTIESAHIAVTEPNRKILIGDDCMFSSSIELRTGDSHSIIDVESRKRLNYAQDIIIGDHVWIGTQAKILKGVIIGNNSIVSAGAIVTANVSNNSIVAGIPAKVVRTNIDWLRERV